jgi:Type I phosphodiesterase / nucleotide pyrophosphatase
VRRRPGWSDVLGAGLLPGLLAGTQIAGLLFFLNPDLPFSPVPVARGILLYGSLLGAVSLAACLPWTWGRPRRARRILPWGLAAALAFAAILDGSQASIYAFFLPSGINDRLVKAAFWFSLAALICFYTALLHGLHRRPYGLRSRLGLTMVAVLSVYVMVERREAFRPRPLPAPQPPVVESGERPRLWVIGLDGATLDAMLPLAAEGQLPFLSTLLRAGAHGRLRSLTPHRPDALWTSLATGMYPDKHGVVGGGIYRADFLAPGAELHLLPVGIAFRRWGTLGGPRAPSAGARSASMLWEILPRLGVRSGVIGWPASAPAPASSAFALTDGYFRGENGPRTAQPTELAARAQALRTRPADVGPELFNRFGPARGNRLRIALAGDLWREEISRSLLAKTPNLEAFFLVLSGLEGISRDYFGGYSAAEFDGARSHLLTEAATIVSTYYSHLDEFLEELWKSDPRPGPRLLALVSAYGVEAPDGTWGRLRAEVSSDAVRRGQTDRSPDGVLILYQEGGGGIAPGTLLTGARLIDLAPTLLYGLGFPVARDFDGKVLTSAFKKEFLTRHPLTFLPSYEALTGPPPGLRPSASRRSD